MSQSIKGVQEIPTDAGSTGGAATTPIENKSLSETELENYLSEGEPEETLDIPPAEVVESVEGEDAPEKEAKVDEEDSEADSLEDLLEKDLEEITEDKLDLIEPVRRAEILKKYPKLFEDFPYLQRAYYRDQKFTEFFTTPAEAQEAHEKANSLDNLDQALLTGNTEKIFRSVKQDDPEAFHRVVDNLLYDLGKVDETAQIHVIRNVGKHLIREMFQESENSNIPALKQAAILLNQFITGSSQFQPETTLAKPVTKNAELDEIRQQRQQLQAEKFETIRDSIVQKLGRAIDNTIKTRLDPNNSMTDFVREAAQRDVNVKIQEIIRKDTRFMNIMNKAWQKAAENGFTAADVEYLNKAYRNKAALILPAVLKQVRSVALRGSRVNKNSENQEVRDAKHSGPVAPGKSAAPNPSGHKTASERAKDIPKGMTTRAWLEAE